MRRKLRKPSLIEILMTSRWPVSATIATICFVLGYLVLPGLLASNIFFRALKPTIQTASLIVSFGFGVVALAKFLHEARARRTATRLTDQLRVVDRTREPSQRQDRGASDDPPFRERTEPSLRPAPNEWSLELLQSIEWKRFEEVIAAYFRAKNFRCETIEYGSDGGVDGRLYFGDLTTPVGVVQCKAWGNRQVGVGPVRELLGVMAHEKVARGYFCATGDFSKDAIAFANSNPIKLITGRDLLDAIAQMPAHAQRELLAVSTTGDYTTPTCPSCGIKLVERTIGGKAAWGCRKYPRCRTKIFRKTDQGTKSASA